MKIGVYNTCGKSNIAILTVYVTEQPQSEPAVFSVSVDGGFSDSIDPVSSQLVWISSTQQMASLDHVLQSSLNFSSRTSEIVSATPELDMKRSSDFNPILYPFTHLSSDVYSSLQSLSESFTIRTPVYSKNTDYLESFNTGIQISTLSSTMKANHSDISKGRVILDDKKQTSLFTVPPLPTENTSLVYVYIQSTMSTEFSHSGGLTESLDIDELLYSSTTLSISVVPSRSMHVTQSITEIDNRKTVTPETGNNQAPLIHNLPGKSRLVSFTALYIQ